MKRTVFMFVLLITMVSAFGQGPSLTRIGIFRTNSKVLEQAPSSYNMNEALAEYIAGKFLSPNIEIIPRVNITLLVTEVALSQSGLSETNRDSLLSSQVSNIDLLCFSSIAGRLESENNWVFVFTLQLQNKRGVLKASQQVVMKTLRYEEDLQPSAEILVTLIQKDIERIINLREQPIVQSIPSEPLKQPASAVTGPAAVAGPAVVAGPTAVALGTTKVVTLKKKSSIPRIMESLAKDSW